MIKLRYASKKDVPGIVQLLEELGYKSDVELIYDRLSKINKRNGQVIVAISESQEVLGCVHAFIDLRLAEGETGEIVSLVVRNDARGQGIGKKLLSEAKDWITANGCVNVRIRANTVREQAHQFYQHQGFNEIKSQKVLQIKVVTNV